MNEKKIIIKKSHTADSRTCDVSKVSKEQLLLSSNQHVNDVKKGLHFFVNMLLEASVNHDFDKFDDIDGFYRDFQVKFKTTEWWDKHRKINRHHLLADDGVPDDVNLIDVIEMIVDCVMAGMGRSGSVYPVEIKDSVLRKAFDNTVALLKDNIVVEK